MLVFRLQGLATEAEHELQDADTGKTWKQTGKELRERGRMETGGMTHAERILGCLDGHLDLYRLGSLDLLLSKLMRDDPIDRSDAIFIVQRAQLSAETVRAAIARVVLPDSEETREQFQSASVRLLKAI